MSVNPWTTIQWHTVVVFCVFVAIRCNLACKTFPTWQQFKYTCRLEQLSEVTMTLTLLLFRT